MSKILYTHRDGVRYLEHCRIVANDKHVSFVMENEKCEKFFNIPHANVACILLGPGTSLTQRAAFMLAEQGVMIGYVGGGGTPLFMASQNEYRPTEFLQKWFRRWNVPANRLDMARQMQLKRCQIVLERWTQVGGHNPSVVDLQAVQRAVSIYREQIPLATTNEQLLGYEANFVKAMYKVSAKPLNLKFTRDAESSDPLNQFINNGNYMAYGLAATALWILGIPHSLPVSHGMTRRGALVFDLADVIKDGFVLPAAMLSALNSENERSFRLRLVDDLHQHEVLKVLIETVQEICQ